MPVLVCSGRDFVDRNWSFRELDRIDRDEAGISMVIHGCAQGADRLAGEWATDRGRSVRRISRRLETHGRAAGPIRHRQMIDEGAPDLVVAVLGGRGHGKHGLASQGRRHPRHRGHRLEEEAQWTGGAVQRFSVRNCARQRVRPAGMTGGFREMRLVPCRPWLYHAFGRPAGSCVGPVVSGAIFLRSRDRASLPSSIAAEPVRSLSPVAIRSSSSPVIAEWISEAWAKASLRS
ncbi:SLOG family protein [Mesorhizobium shangrilense]|uniref:SLOG family protein n=1 Tax=Mesorhizobium shangrilense TaxID=460060 RepID=A0ABV2DRL5_9HYPH